MDVVQRSMICTTRFKGPPVSFKLECIQLHLFNPFKMSFYHITVSSFVLSLLPLLTAQQCYWPDGSDAPAEYKPCVNGRGACCYDLDPEHHDLCYDNGFCYSLWFGSVYRGACTDQSWNNENGCASQCLDCKYPVRLCPFQRVGVQCRNRRFTYSNTLLTSALAS